MEFACVMVVVVIVGIVIIAANIHEDSKKKELEHARRAYTSSLEQLKREPANATLRQRTLELGRVYSNLTRDKEGVTLFDEMAIKNDLDAACAGAVVASIRQPQGPSPSLGMMRFRIHGVDRETGEEVLFEIESPTVQAARMKANAAGYVVSKVEPLG